MPDQQNAVQQNAVQQNAEQQLPTVKRVAVTGASGLVGSRVVAALKERGYEVVRLVRSGNALKADELLWNAASGLARPEQLNGFAAIVHLAGRSIAEARWTEAEKNRLYDSRVAATKQLVKQLVALEQRPPVFIGASAVGLYGDCGDEVVDESRPSGQGFLAEVGRNWEAATAPLLEVGVRVAHARLAMVLEPTGGALAKVLPLFRWGIGGRLGSGRQYWSWIAMEDVVSGICWLLERSEAAGPYNFVSPEPVTNAEFTRALANAVGRPAVLPAPRLALRMALGEMANELLLTSCRAIPRRLVAAGFAFRYKLLADYLADKL